MTGAKMVFISTLTAKATPTLPQVSSGAAKTSAGQLQPPITPRKAGTPLLKIIIAMAMHMPRNPHTIMRGTMPKPFLLYTPSRMRRASISPKVARMANLKNAMMKG